MQKILPVKRKYGPCRGMIAGAALLLLAAPALSAPATAPDEVPVLLNPPRAAIDATGHLNLNVETIESTIYNPASGRNEKVNLRGYKAFVDPQSEGFIGSNSPLVAPTIEVRPGDHLKITLHNNLELEDGCEAAPHNTPHCFNTTNLHTHGLWVSPQQDDIFRKVKPGQTTEYKYDIPPEHPGGTLWYHPHNHGSTAIQVGGGVAGALIVRGTAKPTDAEPGDIDTLLSQIPLKERVMVLQQIHYACFDTKGKIKINKVDKTWRCDPKKDTGLLKNYDQLGFNNDADAPQWPVSGRFTSINDQVLPLLNAEVGTIERWRMIDAGLVNTIGIVIRRLKDGAPENYRHLNSKANGKWVEANCTEDVVHQVSIATDGLTRAVAVDRAKADQPTVLQPGYREDTLLTFPSAGKYCVIDAAASGPGSPANAPQKPQLLGIVVATGSGTVSEVASIHDSLIQAVEKAGYEAKIAEDVRDDLRDGFKLTRFVPHQSLINIKEEIRHQELVFHLKQDGNKKRYFLLGNGGDPTKDRAYNPKEWRELDLGKVDEWTLTSRAKSGGHPFHIHVNPFQIVKIENAAGDDVSVAGEPEKADMQYANLQGTWKDTIFVKEGYKIVIRTRYERFNGQFVLHCHILNHEDRGMMENVRIVDPANRDAPENFLPEVEMGMAKGSHY
ncbi:MAG: multicopper oxidase domain-containing protein [Aliidongia sp.]